MVSLSTRFLAQPKLITAANFFIEFSRLGFLLPGAGSQNYEALFLQGNKREVINTQENKNIEQHHRCTEDDPAQLPVLHGKCLIDPVLEQEK